MNEENKVLIMCEVEQPMLIKFLEVCENEGLSVEEKLKDMMQNFLHKGDNHPIRKSA